MSSLRLGTTLAFLSLAGCATSLTMGSSPPGATVFEGERKIGLTPVDIGEDQLKDDVAGGHLLRVESEGYERVYLWVPAGARKLSFTVNLVPFAKDRERQQRFAAVAASPERLDSVAARLLKIQGDLLAGEGTGPEAEALVAAEGGLGAAFYLSALAALRQSKVDEAKDKLKIAIDLSPQEADYYNLYRQIGGGPLATAVVGDAQAAPAAKPAEEDAE